ncbi:hypothetical protein D3C80_2230650 [compost metagenome]
MVNMMRNQAGPGFYHFLTFERGEVLEGLTGSVLEGLGRLFLFFRDINGVTFISTLASCGTIAPIS